MFLWSLIYFMQWMLALSGGAITNSEGGLNLFGVPGRVPRKFVFEALAQNSSIINDNYNV